MNTFFFIIDSNNVNPGGNSANTYYSHVVVH